MKGAGAQAPACAAARVACMTIFSRASARLPNFWRGAILPRMATKPIPEGYRTVTPGFITRDCDKAIDFIKTVFRAEERMRFLGPDGKVAHCELQLGDSVIMCGEAGDYHAAA